MPAPLPPDPTVRVEGALQDVLAAEARVLSADRPDDVDSTRGTASVSSSGSSSTFADLIRAGSDQRLLRGDWPKWRGYREMRARSSHIYDEDTALEVVAGIPELLLEAEHLRDEIARRLS